jgi:hypothetical protein
MLAFVLGLRELAILVLICAVVGAVLRMVMRRG